MIRCLVRFVTVDLSMLILSLPAPGSGGWGVAVGGGGFVFTWGFLFCFDADGGGGGGSPSHENFCSAFMQMVGREVDRDADFQFSSWLSFFSTAISSKGRLCQCHTFSSGIQCTAGIKYFPTFDL